MFLDWSDDDRAKAIAFVLEKGSRCFMCGTAGWEWDPEQGGSRHAYEAVEKFCHGCYVKSSMSRDIDSSDGHTIELAPTAGVEAARRHQAARRAYMKGKTR